MPRPFSIETPDRLENIIAMYFRECDEKVAEGEAKFPSLEGMYLYIQRHVEKRFGNVQKYIEDKMSGESEEAEDYRLVMTMAQWQMSDWLQNTATTNPKLATGCIALLKQRQYGGFVDRVKEESAQITRVDISGLGIELPKDKAEKKGRKK